MVLKVRAVFVIYITFIFGLIVFMPSLSRAACTSPAQPLGTIEYFSSGSEQVHKYCDGTNWVAWGDAPIVAGAAAPSSSSSATALNELSDVDTTGVADGEILMYSAGGLVWIPGAGGGGGALNDLSDAYTDYVTDFNIFVGQDAGASILAGGQSNTFMGQGAGNKITTGDNNTFIGLDAGHDNITGSNNVMLGRDAGYQSTAGSDNVFIGYQTGNWEQGNKNVYVGQWAGSDMQFAGDGYNTALGYDAMDGDFGTGVRNTALGALSGWIITNGSDNITIGYDAGSSIKNGNQNIIIGNSAAATLNSGSDNIIIGYNIDTPLTTTSNYMSIGNTIYADLSTDTVGIGKVPAAGVELDVLGDIHYTGQIVDVSDIRLKENIHPLQSSLAKLTSLQGLSFEMKDDPEDRIENGFSAQEVQKAFPELVHVGKDEMGTMSVNYIGLIAPMVEAMKEQQAEINALRATNRDLRTRLNRIETYLATDRPVSQHRE